jgi:hypothetical protein
MQNNEAAESAAIIASENWLNLIDNDNIAESWHQAASIFKNAVSEEQWKASLEAAKTPLGKVMSRELSSKQYAEELPGAPDGEYVVIQYKTTFENKAHGIETVTPMKDTDGEWRVAGYFIK